MIPFRITPLPLPDNITYRSGYYSEWVSNQRAVEDRLFNRIWTVTAIKTNPRGGILMGSEGLVSEPYFTIYRHSDHNPFPCNLFLLVREDETPIWWPDIYCEVVEVPKPKNET